MRSRRARAPPRDLQHRREVGAVRGLDHVLHERERDRRMAARLQADAREQVTGRPIDDVQPCPRDGRGVRAPLRRTRKTAMVGGRPTRSGFKASNIRSTKMLLE